MMTTAARLLPKVHVALALVRPSGLLGCPAKQTSSVPIAGHDAAQWEPLGREPGPDLKNIKDGFSEAVAPLYDVSMCSGCSGKGGGNRREISLGTPSCAALGTSPLPLCFTEKGKGTWESDR